MFDIKLIRENAAQVKTALKSKNIEIDTEVILSKDEKRRALIAKIDALRFEQNKANDEISKLIKEKKDPKEKIAAMKTVSKNIAELDPQIKALEEELSELLIGIPNLPHSSVPIGGESANETIKEWGEKKTFAFTPKSHIDIAQDLDIIDFKRGAKLTGSGFILYKGLGARLERALINFMLDLHTAEHNYKEVMPPILVNADSMTGTGQLPKMAEDMYKLAEDPFYLIPTAEVPVTNIHRDEILSTDVLPIYYTAYTPCFRREAGSYGKDTKGLVRVHQFDKVELVKFVAPETSYDELETLLFNAERVFQLLQLPYRVLLLASGDLSFAAAKCYDIEAFAPGIDSWLEVSSCSNFESFQARRANIRYKDNTTKKTTFVHTLNGSGVALARCMVAILENYQQEDGAVLIPEILQPYMGGLDRITK